MGDVILDGKHFTDGHDWPDKAYPCSWDIDIHFPKLTYQKGFEGDEFIPDYTRATAQLAAKRTASAPNIIVLLGRRSHRRRSGLGAYPL